MPARVRKPTKLKLLDGDHKKNPQRFRNKEPEPPKGLPECPQHLKGIARRKWTETVKVLDEMGILSRAERTILEQFCVVYQKWREAESRIDIVSIGNLLLKLNIELGLSYPARSRINLGTKEEPHGIEPRKRA